MKISCSRIRGIQRALKIYSFGFKNTWTYLSITRIRDPTAHAGNIHTRNSKNMSASGKLNIQVKWFQYCINYPYIISTQLFNVIPYFQAQLQAACINSLLFNATELTKHTERRSMGVRMDILHGHWIHQIKSGSTRNLRQQWRCLRSQSNRSKVNVISAAENLKRKGWGGSLVLQPQRTGRRHKQTVFATACTEHIPSASYGVVLHWSKTNKCPILVRNITGEESLKVPVCTTTFNVQKICIFPRSVFMLCNDIITNTDFSVWSTNGLVFIMKTICSLRGRS